jgi:hypothetical protein
MTRSNPTRRDVLAATAAGLAAAAVPAAMSPAADPPKEPTPVNAATPSPASPPATGPTAPATAAPEFYELRALRLRRGPMGKRLDDYLRDAFIPAARRAGCGPVGAFNVTIGPGNPSVYVLIPHPTVESFATLADKLAADPEYKKAGEPFLTLPPTDPPYLDHEVQLLKAFPHFAKLEVPEKKPRIFELRTYRSHSRSAARKKVEMFDTAGEIAIFRRVGLTPVFFAQTLTGTGLPSLTYLLTFPDLATREKTWNAFRGDPEWKTLSTTPGYTDAEIVTDINNQILAPTAYSQV